MNQILPEQLLDIWSTVFLNSILPRGEVMLAFVFERLDESNLIDDLSQRT
jgi:hypothetical protein